VRELRRTALTVYSLYLPLHVYQVSRPVLVDVAQSVGIWAMRQAPGLQSHLANLGTGGATLRFGRVWTGAMFVQVALTAIGIPVTLESASEAVRNLKIRARFPSREYLAARIDVDRRFEQETTSTFAARRERTVAELQRRIAQEPSSRVPLQPGTQLGPWVDLKIDTPGRGA
jgi:hypothetical protein